MTNTTTMNLGRYKGKIAVVTAAAKGIGRATALRLGHEGAYVVALDIDPAVSQTAKELEQLGVSSESGVIDCSNRKSVESIFADILKKHVHIDMLANVMGLIP